MVDARPINAEQEFEASEDGSFVSVNAAEAHAPPSRLRGSGEAAKRIRAKLGIEPATEGNKEARWAKNEGTAEDCIPQGKDQQSAEIKSSWKHSGEASRRIRINLGVELPGPAPESVRTEEDLEKERQEDKEKKAWWDTTVNTDVLKCMRCDAKGMTCSLTYFGPVWKNAVKCTRCQRNGCKYCVRQTILSNGRCAAMLHPSVVLSDEEVAEVGALIQELAGQIRGSDDKRRALPHWIHDLAGKGVWLLEGDRRTWRDVLPVWQNVSHAGAKKLESALETKQDPAPTPEFLQLYARGPSYGRRFKHLKELAETDGSSEGSEAQLEEYLRAEGRYDDFKNEGWREAALADRERVPDRKSDNEPARRSGPDAEGNWYYQNGLERDDTVSWTTTDDVEEKDKVVLQEEPNGSSSDTPTERYVNQCYWKALAEDSSPSSPRQWRNASQEVDKAFEALEEEQRQEELRAIPKAEKERRFEALRADQKKMHAARMAQIRD